MNNKNLTLFLATRYLRCRFMTGNLSVMLLICFLGIFVGAASLALTLSITRGFEDTINNKIRGINPHAVIYEPGRKLDEKIIKDYVTENFGTFVKSVSSSSTRQIIINQGDSNGVAFIRGIETKSGYMASSIREKIVDSISPGNFVEELLDKNQIIVGHKFADQHGVAAGDSLNVLIPRTSNSKKIDLQEKELIVSGIINVGLEEFDRHIVFCSMELINKLFKINEGVDSIEVMFSDNLPLPSITGFYFLDSVIYWFKQRVPFFYSDPISQLTSKMQTMMPEVTVSSWQDLYPALVSSLKLEKYVMFLVILLIVLVASMNMISLLFMQIQSKKRGIAILQAIGMAREQISRIFLLWGLVLTVIASFFGLVFAGFVAYMIEAYKLIKLPDVYFVEYLPAALDPEIFLVVFICVVIMGVLASWIPVRRAGRINVSMALRQE